MRVYLLLISILVICSHAHATDTSVTVTDLAASPQNTYTYSDQDAAKIVKAIEGLSWDGTTGARCHTPRFRVQATSQDKQLLDATVCFDCHNVRFSIPKDRGLKGFRSNHDSAKWLELILTQIFDAKKP